MSKVWFVTGSSRGLGRAFVEAALSRGDRVAATARSRGGAIDAKKCRHRRSDRNGTDSRASWRRFWYALPTSRNR